MYAATTAIAPSADNALISVFNHRFPGFQVVAVPRPGRRHEWELPVGGLLAGPRQEGPFEGGILLDSPHVTSVLQ